MNIPEEFGKYLLLKKLSEDALGETFRAGKLGKDGLEQVVLLRVFNGKGLDGERLWARMSGRAAVHQALRSPNIGSGADLGKVRSYPYAAYDYISGKNLAALLERAGKQGSPIPTDHALLIAERLLARPLGGGRDPPAGREGAARLRGAAPGHDLERGRDPPARFRGRARPARAGGGRLAGP